MYDNEMTFKDKLRREQDILDRIDNVKRLIQMEYTLLTSNGCGNFSCRKMYGRSDDKVFGDSLIDDLREEIQLQLFSIAALCYGCNPDIGEPSPMLEWKHEEVDGEHPADAFHDMFEKCLTWNA